MFLNWNFFLEKREKIFWGIGVLIFGFVTLGIIVWMGGGEWLAKTQSPPMQQDDSNYTDWIQGEISDVTERGYIIDIERNSGFVDNILQFEVNKQVFTGSEEFLLKIGQNVRVMLNGKEIEWEEGVPFAKIVFDIYMSGNNTNGMPTRAPRNSIK